MSSPPQPPADLSLTTSIRFAEVRADRVWEFAWSQEQVGRWFGQARPGPQSGSHVAVGTGLGAGRTGTLQVIGRSGQPAGFRHGVQVLLSPRPGSATAPTTALIVIEADGSDGCVVTVTESGFSDATDLREALGSWRDALARLRDDVRDAAAHDHRPCQAIVVFHGMGNQRPGETLQGLVRSGVIEPVADGPLPDGVWLKPDRVTDDFELHVCTFQATEGQQRPRTDVYEAYWAPQVGDTSTAQVTAWAVALLGRFRGVPAPLNASLWLLRLLLAAALVGVVAVRADWVSLPSWLTTTVAVVVATALWRVLVGWYAGVLGDVARYLRPTPDNIQTRARVRQQGIELLDRLHDHGRYDRIVVVAHSLGSIVAYDVLTHLWVQRHRRHARPRSAGFKQIRDCERAIGVVGDPATGQTLQHRAWKRMRLNTQPWLVTDFVTVGSPLAHGRVLLRGSRASFEAATSDRVLPSCPPATEVETGSGHRRMSYERPYRTPTGHPRTFTMLQHSALFGVTRWTNLYFTSRALGLVGDPIGGPVAPDFGCWVKDVPLATKKLLVSAHVGYWTPGVTDGDVHLSALREALDLQLGGELSWISRSLPLRRVEPGTG